MRPAAIAAIPTATHLGETVTEGTDRQGTAKPVADVPVTLPHVDEVCVHDWSTESLCVTPRGLAVRTHRARPQDTSNSETHR